jgi:hypothetical protein
MTFACTRSQRAPHGQVNPCPRLLAPQTSTHLLHELLLGRGVAVCRGGIGRRGDELRADLRCVLDRDLEGAHKLALAGVLGGGPRGVLEARERSGVVVEPRARIGQLPREGKQGRLRVWALLARVRLHRADQPVDVLRDRRDLRAVARVESHGAHGNLGRERVVCQDVLQGLAGVLGARDEPGNGGLDLHRLGLHFLHGLAVRARHLAGVDQLVHPRQQSLGRRDQCLLHT